MKPNEATKIMIDRLAFGDAAKGWKQIAALSNSSSDFALLLESQFEKYAEKHSEKDDLVEVALKGFFKSVDWDSVAAELIGEEPIPREYLPTWPEEKPLARPARKYHRKKPMSDSHRRAIGRAMRKVWAQKRAGKRL